MSIVRKKLLLVDDSSVVLMTEKLILNSTYDLVFAKNGLEALEKASVEQPDLILLDVVMPKMNGFETCKELRSREQTKATPIIMVTTRGESTNIDSGFESGCTDYVLKPFNNLDLITKIRKYLGE